jgi:hypothetical protein
MLQPFISFRRRAFGRRSPKTAARTQTCGARRVRLLVELLEGRDAPSVTLVNPGNQTNYDGDQVSLALSATDTSGAPLM